MKFLLKTPLMLFCLVGACASMTPYFPIARELSEPPLNSISVASVGDTMVRQGKYTEHEGIRLSQELTINPGALLNDRFTVHAGDYLKIGQIGSEQFFVSSNGPGAGRLSPAGAPGDLSRPESFSLFKMSMIEDDRICFAYLYRKDCTSAVGVEKAMLAGTSANAFQQALIYSGKIGNKINIGYRESSNDVARPAFNNDVEYDLSESMTIGYKGALIEILEATNQFIRYRVIRNFNVGS